MNLLTDNILKDFRNTGSQENSSDPIVIVKYFYGNFTWYATEYDEENEIFFGYVIGHECEWGYFSLWELKSFKGPFGLGIERDLYFEKQPISEAIELCYE